MKRPPVAVAMRMRRSAGQVKAAIVREDAIKKSWLVLVCCVRNEMPRLPMFLAHYRKLGVQHFIIVDNMSTDTLHAYLKEQPDCSVWLGDGSYKNSNFGMDWCNHLLATYCVDKWVVTVDPDEFLVFPYCEIRGLRSLTRYMEAVNQLGLLTVMLDAYSNLPLTRTDLTPETDPFDLCPYFDRFNLTQRHNAELNNFWVQGGVRMRRFFSDTPERAPALNKVPLVFWRKGLHYVSSMHHLNDPDTNCTVYKRPDAVSGALFHFKYVNLLQSKAKEELERGEHYAGSFEYKAYAQAGDVVLYDPRSSIRYENSQQLEQLGFMQAGTWY